jgi:hypothetical protein
MAGVAYVRRGLLLELTCLRRGFGCAPPAGGLKMPPAGKGRGPFAIPRLTDQQTIA